MAHMANDYRKSEYATNYCPDDTRINGPVRPAKYRPSQDSPQKGERRYHAKSMEHRCLSGLH